MGPRLLKPGEKYPLDQNCHHYTNLSQVPWDIQKYWHQRFSIFEFYDYDIHLTDSAWFGVTPEPVATRIARDLSSHSIGRGKRVLIDLFGGAGGNVIAFALSPWTSVISGDGPRWDRIIAIEKDQSTLACAQHNAEVYGVLDRIEWVHGDSFGVMRRFWEAHGGQGKREKEGQKGREEEGGEDNELDQLLAELNPAECLIFASPPWGGVSYRNQEVFDLSKMEPYNLEQLYEACSSSPSFESEGEEGRKQILPQALFLPRQSDLNQIAALISNGAAKIDVVQYCQKGASKALVAYLPGNIDAPNKYEETRHPGEEEKGQGQGQGQRKRKHNCETNQGEEQAMPELLLSEAQEEEALVEETSVAYDASFDDSYIQDTSHIEARDTPNIHKRDSNEKRKRKRRRRSSHNN